MRMLHSCVRLALLPWVISGRAECYSKLTSLSYIEIIIYDGFLLEMSTVFVEK